MFTSPLLAFRHSPNHHKSAFTLIELLVVIAIIAILAAILFPVFGRARENARRSSCSSNLKQIALGVFQYTQDYDEKFPKALHDLDTNGVYNSPDIGWIDEMQPYLKSYQIFQCPSDSTASTTDPYTTGYVDYGGNSNVFNDYNAISLSALNNAATTFLLCETMGPNVWAFNRGDSRMSYNDWSFWTPRTFQTIHLDGSNFAFADGHVKWLKPTNVKGTAATTGDFTFGDAGL